MIDPATPPWLPRVLATLGRLGGSPIVVGVSGGGDSVGLLRALHGRGLRLSVAHLDHGVRGAEGAGDARFVADLAAGLGLDFDLGRWAPTRSGHFEADARRARYGWLAEVARARGARAVAVGQTADDQAETILHRIVRGTGVGGLGGMAPRRRLAPGLVLVRPLLEVSRAEVRGYLASIGQEFREDSSNLDTSRTRARIRLDLLPKLAEDYNPAVAEALVRLGRLARLANRAMIREAGRSAKRAIIAVDAGRIVLDRSVLVTLPASDRAEVVRLAWRRAGWPEGGMDAGRWGRVAGMVGRLSVGGGVEATLTADQLILDRTGLHLPPEDRQGESCLTGLDVPGSAKWFGGRIVASLEESGACDEWVDLDLLVPPLVVRRGVPGDRFEPLGMGGRSRPLNDFFRGRGVARGDRGSVPIVCDGQGIVWVVGHRIAHRVRLTEGTGRRLGLRFEPDREEPG